MCIILYFLINIVCLYFKKLLIVLINLINKKEKEINLKIKIRLD